MPIDPTNMVRVAFEGGPLDGQVRWVEWPIPGLLIEPVLRMPLEDPTIPGQEVDILEYELGSGCLPQGFTYRYRA